MSDVDEEDAVFCPQCQAEYREGVSQCSRCGIALVAELPSDAAAEWVDFVTVLITRDHSELALAKSLLEGADIPFFAKNEEVESLFAAGPVELQVRPEDAAEARELLHDLNERPEG
jgi:hypothetical protein